MYHYCAWSHGPLTKVIPAQVVCASGNHQHEKATCSSCRSDCDIIPAESCASICDGELITQLAAWEGLKKG